jgi:hypothetical protein
MHYQLRDGPHADEPTTERGEIERLARECEAAECLAGLDLTVVDTRFTVVRSSVPDPVTTARTLRDYLSLADMARAVALSVEPRQNGGRAPCFRRASVSPTEKSMRRPSTPT